MNRIFLIISIAFSQFALAEESKAPVVEVQKAENKELFDEMTFPARVESSVVGTVNSEADGVVTNVHVSIGQAVRAKTPIVTVKNMDPVYEYMPVAMLSPISGVVSAIDVSQGTSVRKGQTLVTITNPDHIRIRVEIAASDVAYFKPKMVGAFTAPNFGITNAIPVKVRGVSPQVDSITGTASAEIVPEGNTKISLGLIGRVTFKVNQRQGIQVPDSAIVYRGKETFVRTVDKDKVKMNSVVIASSNRGNVELKSGLNIGDQVIIRTSGFLADGQMVTVQKGNVATN